MLARSSSHASGVIVRPSLRWSWACSARAPAALRAGIEAVARGDLIVDQPSLRRWHLGAGLPHDHAAPPTTNASHRRGRPLYGQTTPPTTSSGSSPRRA